MEVIVDRGAISSRERCGSHGPTRRDRCSGNSYDAGYGTKRVQSQGHTKVPRPRRRPDESECAMTTTDDRKMTPIEAIAVVQEFRADLEQWDKFLGSRWLSQQRELDEDYGELDRLGGSSRKLLVVLDMFGDNPALNDNAVDEMRGWSNAFIKREVNNLRGGYCERLAPALDAIESGLRTSVGANQSGWKPPDGYAPAKAVYTDEGKRVPRTTVQQWIEQDKPDKKQDPDTHAVYVPKKWLKGRLDKYCPRERN